VGSQLRTDRLSYGTAESFLLEAESTPGS
jgi:hypothetical protein